MSSSAVHEEERRKRKTLYRLRELNQVTVKNKYPLLHIDDLFN